MDDEFNQGDPPHHPHRRPAGGRRQAGAHACAGVCALPAIQTGVHPGRGGMTRPAHQSMLNEEVLLRLPGRVDYLPTFRAMQNFTSARTPDTPDEIWLLEHPPVFTMGLKGRCGTLTHVHDIPVVYTDRGGDMTYHGPGQLVAYILMDMNRRGWGAKHLVTALEQAVIHLLAAHHIRAERRAGADGG